jgi:hypothetical protein
LRLVFHSFMYSIFLSTVWNIFLGVVFILYKYFTIYW